MKKLFAFVLVPVLAVTLSACGLIQLPGGNSTSNPPTTKSTPSGVGKVDFDAIFAGTSTMKFDGLTEAEEKDIIDQGKAAGVAVTFLHVTGTIAIFDRLSDHYAAIWEDGKWRFEKDYLEQREYSEWPDIKWTKVIPKPDFKLAKAESTTYGFNAEFTDTTLDTIKAYAEQLKAAGYTIIKSEEEKDDLYNFWASSTNGYAVLLKFYPGRVSTLAVMNA